MRTLDQLSLRTLTEHELTGVEALADLARRGSAEPIRFQAALNLIGFDHQRRAEALEARADGMPRAVAERIVALEEQLAELPAPLDIADVIADAVGPLIARIEELEAQLAHGITPREEGAADAKRGIPENANPYRKDGRAPDAMKAAAWLDGWRSR